MLDLYLLVISFILGMVEGLTEFLPISSSLHMNFVGELLGFSDDKVGIVLNVVIQLGAVLSIVFVFWKSFFVVFIKRVCFGNFGFFSGSFLSCGHIILGVLPTVVLGLIFYENVKNVFKIQYMIYFLILGGVLLLIAEWFTREFYVLDHISNIDDLSYLQAFVIGCFQCLSLCPGFSRSGVTISGGLMVGLNRYVASTFSFVLAVPMIFSATVLVLYKNFYFITWEYFPVLVIGFLSSFFTSLFTVKFFMEIIRCVSFVPFAVYRFIVAIVLCLFY
ncbi:undecaprenyl-diphosphatase UppP [Blochmannia endosymbiont of Polyrhachis (Hedomyrma) turneri]|uniref:undecaprenyl-diphosphatase UppP n=1 Tax=Blochmannia endosymbiont of Polyrhachis (Hedomyrma) turneri TaxID=1505596 RepID=UPI00061A5592|nr:undecaprenyl-diphosphatase UppP [Blochmannia endosymbiont of Polyrhachis (Hedomyrma) turneri]AKC59652.1 Undecaprenyl-diphosphatase [Blochmannia endosymbiont of Polyrhachis (Hedomyrma) turneri]